MQNQTQWKATWIDRSGNKRELAFDGPASRSVARLDFQLRLFDQGERIPAHFELEESTMVLPAFPQRKARLQVRAGIPHRPTSFNNPSELERWAASS